MTGGVTGVFATTAECPVVRYFRVLNRLDIRLGRLDILA